MWALMFSQSRYSGLSNTTFQVAETQPDPHASNCSNANYKNFYGSRDESFLHISRVQCNNTGQRRKFLVAHEYGHALGF